MAAVSPRDDNVSTAAPQRMRPPWVLVPACQRQDAEQAIHFVGQEYTTAVRLAGAQPLIVPGASPDAVDAWLDLADGVLLTGSPSNVHPRHYGEAVANPRLPLDEARDAWTLPLVPRALARGVPLLAICRGFQEANVALGGSLHQAVHKVPGLADHREPRRVPPDAQYAPAHPVTLTPGGVLATLLGRSEVHVNSLHGQGVNRLADRAQVEALAPDGLVEAFRVKDAPGFNLFVQWHPEWDAANNPLSLALFTAFGEACRRRAASR
jgi:putative glutamine amidotransferase